MLRPRTSLTTLAILAGAVAIGGCGPNKPTSASTGNGTIISSPTERAAYAGHAAFPATQPSGELPVVAIVSRDKKQLRLYNVGKQAVRNVDVWVNGSFVTRIGGIAPLSNVVISTTEIYNGLGHSLASRGEEVSRVQADEGGHLYNLMGPVTE
jgi:hypothetical protein